MYTFETRVPRDAGTTIDSIESLGSNTRVHVRSCGRMRCESRKDRKKRVMICTRASPDPEETNRRPQSTRDHAIPRVLSVRHNSRTLGTHSRPVAVWHILTRHATRARLCADLASIGVNGKMSRTPTDRELGRGPSSVLGVVLQVDHRMSPNHPDSQVALRRLVLQPRG